MKVESYPHYIIGAEKRDCRADFPLFETNCPRAQSLFGNVAATKHL